jgi:hypothetical protein
MEELIQAEIIFRLNSNQKDKRCHLFYINPNIIFWGVVHKFYQAQARIRPLRKSLS